jgi:hypothetical protein
MTMASFVEVAGSILTGVLSGGATGLLGVVIQQWGDQKKRVHDLDVLKQQHAQTIELKRLEGDQAEKMAQMSADSAERLAEIQAAARADESASADYKASMDNDGTRYLPAGAKLNPFVIVMLGIVDFMRGIIRPGITIYCMALLTLLLIWVNDMWQRSLLNLTPDDAKKLAMEVITTTTYLTVTSVIWWFGRRPEAPPKR